MWIPMGLLMSVRCHLLELVKNEGSSDCVLKYENELKY